MDIESVARIVFLDCLGAKPGKQLLVVTDTEKKDVGEILFEAARVLGLKAVLLVMESTAAHGAEPPSAVAEAMKHCDLVVCPTRYSLTHTRARMEACQQGARIATMPNISEEMFSSGAMTADYGQIAYFTDRLKERLDRASRVRIEYRGRVLELSIEGRLAISSNGRFHDPGSSGNLPTGEAYLAPVEGSAEGRLLIDGSLAELGLLSSPLEVVVEKGRAIDFSGPDAKSLEHLLGPVEEARNIGELGIGTNPKARLSGNILVDEKIYGTAHIAFGSNATFGGLINAGVHIDGIMIKPAVYLDGELLVQDGKIIF
jgi:leucyl aminopeptidase (aminopeptidase T)